MNRVWHDSQNKMKQVVLCRVLHNKTNCGVTLVFGALLLLFSMRRERLDLVASYGQAELATTHSAKRRSNLTAYGDPTAASGADTAEQSSKDASTNSTIKIPYPVYVASLYKSGTTTIHDYFVCGNQRAGHNGPARGVYFNMRQGKDPFDGFKLDVFSDLSHFRGTMCFEPSSAMRLETIYKFHPNMTMILAVRNAAAWVDSVNKFYDLGYLLKTQCRTPGYFRRWPKHENVTDRDLQAFYEWQVGYVRQFAKDHPSISYIEIQLENPDSGSILEDRIGIPAHCWGHSNKASDRAS